MRTANSQLDLLVSLSGGKLANRLLLPPAQGSGLDRTLRVIVSILAFMRLSPGPSMAIVGEGALWGKGRISCLRRLGVGAFMEEVRHGRPVIFVEDAQINPFERIAEFLSIDGDKVDSFLNGNACLTASGARNGAPIFAHVGSGSEGEAALTRHEQGLTSARAALADTSLLRAIAQPMEHRVARDISVLVQSYLPGERLRVWASADPEILSLLMASARPLIEIHHATAGRLSPPEATLLRRMREDLAALEMSAQARHCLTLALDETQAWMESRRPKSVYVHGDYGLHNLLFDSTKNVSAIADWEWTRGDGCAGFDAVHIGILAAAERYGPSITSVAASVVDGHCAPVLTDYFHRILPELDLSADDAPNLALLVWLVVVFRGALWTRPGSDDWLDETVAPMLPIMEKLAGRRQSGASNARN